MGLHLGLWAGVRTTEVRERGRLLGVLRHFEYHQLLEKLKEA